MSDRKGAAAHSVWPLILTAAAILMITMGDAPVSGAVRLSAEHHDRAGHRRYQLCLGRGTVRLGRLAADLRCDRGQVRPYSRVIIVGAILLAAGSAFTPFVSSAWMLLLTLGVLAAAGAGAGSFSILIGATAGRVPAERRAFAAGVINAGGSFGQFVFAPLNQALISAFGWVTAMIAMAVAALATIPLAGALGKRPPAQKAQGSASPAAPELTLRAQLHSAARNKSYWLLHAGFFDLWLPHRIPGHAPAGGSATVWNVCGRGGDVASDHRSREHRWQPDRGCAGERIPAETGRCSGPTSRAPWRSPFTSRPRRPW